MHTLLKRSLRYPLNQMLKLDPIRRRIAFILKCHYFSDLEISIPLSHGFSCNISNLDSFESFSEIFLEGEYAPFLREIDPIPHRWLDIGCHVGYFSLWLAWQIFEGRGIGERHEIRALLIDADRRVTVAVEKLIQNNGLQDSFSFEHGLIGSESGSAGFYERAYMASSAESREKDSRKRVVVPVLSADQIYSILPGPYDLIKVDIEGGEDVFLNSYKRVISSAVYLLLEWHAKPGDSDRVTGIRKMVVDNGFKIIRETRKPPLKLSVEVECGLFLGKNTRKISDYGES